MTKEKSNSVVTTEINVSIGELVVNVLGAGRVTFHAGRVHPENRAYAEFHGWKQRLVDKAALGFNKAENRWPTAGEKLKAITAVIEHYETGTNDWSMRRVGGTRRVTDVGLLALVLGELNRKFTEEWLDGLEKAQIAAILNRPEFKVVADRIRGEAGAGVDTDALLAGLG